MSGTYDACSQTITVLADRLSRARTLGTVNILVNVVLVVQVGRDRVKR